MVWCSHDFVRDRGSRTCSKCGYRQRRRRRTGYRNWRRQGRRGRRKAAAKIELSVLYDHALELANEDRAKHGLEPVALSETGSAQDHADDMMEIGYYSHWHSEGVKPYATYTKHGGTGYVAENIGANWCSGYCYPIDPFEAIKKHQRGMVYRDAHADWGHRDNILNPAHTHVNFGISYSGSKLYFVQHFESNGAGWSDVHLKDGKLVMDGTARWGGTPLISIYRDPEPEPLSARQLGTVEPYSLPFYKMGEMVGMVVKVPSGGAYRQCPNGDLLTQDGCYPYSFWRADTRSDGRIRITADVSKWAGTGGLHTALVFLPGADGVHVPSSVVTLEYLERGGSAARGLSGLLGRDRLRAWARRSKKSCFTVRHA